MREFDADVEQGLDPEEEALKADKERTRAELEHDGMTAALETLEGRAFLWSLLYDAGFLQHHHPENRSRHNYAITVYDRLCDCNQALAVLMIKENTA